MTWADDYEPVEDRLRKFWQQHPYGRVITELLHADHELHDYIVRAEIYFGNELRNDPPTASGLAHDSAAMLNPSLRNSALEICETSAIGRALANANYATKKRPSREEMVKEPAASRSPGAKGDGAAHPARGPYADREAVDTSAAVDGMGKASAAADDPLTTLIASYGTAAKALVAARRLWDVTSVSQLGVAQIEVLMAGRS